MSKYYISSVKDNGETLYDVRLVSNQVKVRTFAIKHGAESFIKRQDAADEKEARLGRQIALAEKLLAEINELTGMEFTFGYIGNCTPRYDNRQWSMWAPHPGRSAKDDDVIEFYDTDNLALLIAKMNTARTMARWMSQKAERS